MKRLIKAEYFSGGKKNYKTYFCFKNPTNKEWNIINNDSGGNIRGFINEDGILYIWNGEITHSEITILLNDPLTIPLNDTKIHISIENGRIQYINSGFLTNKQIILALQKCESLLNFFNRDTQYIGFYPEFSIGDLGDIIDFKE